MALGRDSIAAARKINDDFKLNSKDLELCFDQLAIACGEIEVYKIFVNETEIGKNLDNRLKRLTSAMIQASHQAQAIGNVTEQFLNRQEMINAGK